ncbi:MAG: hypothetical protein HN341_06060 [Verrucomicrobia bacterium]|nr:hypothetical protein [Verrucomicrobiota bacterium]
MKQRKDRFVLDAITRIRVKEQQPQPPMVEEFNEKYTAYCLKRAEAEYKENERWFYCEDKQEYGDSIRWDEVVTFQIYWQLRSQLGSLEELPNYSKENHQKAIEFWQRWQQKDGAFHNILTKKGDPNSCNQKYIPNIMKLLGCQPMYETSGYGPAQLNAVKSMREITAGNMNWGTATAAVMFERIHEGDIETIPILEQVVELAVAQLSPHTGMFHGPGGNPSGEAWIDYGLTAETMKGFGRIIGYMGVENIPYRHVRADKLIENQEWFHKSHVSVKRNTAEMMMQCLLESSYRKDELLEALDAHSSVIMSGKPWTSNTTGDYAAYVLLIFGSYLHWKGYEGRPPRTQHHQGVGYDWRVEVGPFGRSVNIIRKRPEERLTDKDFSYAQYGMRARNAAHEKRSVIDVVLASAEGWTVKAGKTGGVSAACALVLDPAILQNPYIKIKWSGGDIEIFLNNVPVKKKLGNWADFGAVHVPDEARKALRNGENTLMVRSKSPADNFSVSAGLIDWRLE